MQNVLVLVRHGQSEWNSQNLFTGWKNPALTDKGVAQAREAGRLIKAEGLSFDVAYTSLLGRAQHTLQLILEELGQSDIEIIKDIAVNERDYGELAGLNKDEARAKFGDDKVHTWRRSYDVSPPGGESLKDTAERVLPHFEAEILPKLKEGKNVLIAGHGNALRALSMRLEGMTPEQITKYSIKNGVPLIYEFDGVENFHDRRDLVAA